MKEADLKLAVSEYLQYGTNQGKWYADRLNSGAVYVKRGDRTYGVQLCREGTADIMVLDSGKPPALEYANNNPRIIFLELKGDKGKQRPEQGAFQRLIEAQGAEYYIVRSVEDVMEILGEAHKN